MKRCFKDWRLVATVPLLGPTTQKRDTQGTVTGDHESTTIRVFLRYTCTTTSNDAVYAGLCLQPINLKTPIKR
jgi:hypothetical protein